MAFCTLWWERFGNNPVTAGDLFEVLKERQLLLDIFVGRSTLSAQQRLGHALANRRDRIFGTWRIRLAGRAGNGSAAYRLEENSRRTATSKTMKTPKTMQDEPEAEVRVSRVSGVFHAVDGAENMEDDGWQEV